METDDEDTPAWFATVYEAARQIPPGKVASYGQLADMAGVTARMSGRALWAVPDGVPWWRVVGSDGSLRIGKRDPALAKIQRERLEIEGVKVSESGRVENRFFIDE